MFWQIAILALVFLFVIGYYLLAGIAPTTRDLELLRRLDLSMRWIIGNRQAFEPKMWQFRRFGKQLLAAVFPLLQRDLRKLCQRGRKWLGLGFLLGLYFWYGALWVKNFCFLGEPQDLRVILGFQILAVRRLSWTS